MILTRRKKQKGFSLLELLVSMTIMLILLALVSGVLVNTLSVKDRESRRTDALTSSEAALNLISREIANSGYGLTNNGLVLTDSNSTKLHFRANINNTDSTTNSPGEDVTYYLDDSTNSIVRYDRYASSPTSAIVNRVSSITFQYFDYTSASSTPVQKSAPTANTCRVRIILSVLLDPVTGEPSNQSVTFTSDITLRNATYMLNQY